MPGKGEAGELTSWREPSFSLSVRPARTTFLEINNFPVLISLTRVTQPGRLKGRDLTEVALTDCFDFFEHVSKE